MIIKKIAAYLLYGLIQLLAMTLRLKIEKNDFPKPPFILALWHSRLLLLAPLMRKAAPIIGYTVLISKSTDGDIPSLYAKLFQLVKVIRVGHKSRAAALKESIQAIERGEVLVITPDGPRGPALEVKPGILFAAKNCSVPIVTMGWSASKSISLRSWDRFLIPLPFSTITVRFEQTSHEVTKEELEKSLDRISGNPSQ